MCESTFNGWNPIVNGCTIAPYVMFVLKHKYIKKGDLGYFPENCYGVENNSMLALKYIQWLEKKDSTLHLKYKLRGGEVKIEANGSSYFADAFNEATKDIFENKYDQRLKPRVTLYGGRTQAFRSMAVAELIGLNSRPS
ncbi:hypothetical protein CRE_02697 [Caenorhabditis remanei]|uniref:Uncharacterized protein n=1 Tax=Caenorhabditis remanei TaxID=31234 RepID=E3NKZ7_CAERE|nr:hypothetical protein CRE_02697 [Caenorhabditis remanei]